MGMISLCDKCINIVADITFTDGSNTILCIDCYNKANLVKTREEKLNLLLKETVFEKLKRKIKNVCTNLL